MRLNRNLPPKITQKENLKVFYEAIASLKNAGMENLNYLQIANRLKVSRGTIARVNRWLKYGAGGYRLVLGVYA